MIVCLLGATAPPLRAAEPPLVEATLLDGEVLTGRAVQLFPQVVLRSETAEKTFAWNDALTVKVLEPSAAAHRTPEPLQFLLADGSLVAGNVEGATEGGLVIRFGAGQTARLETSMLRAIRALGAAEGARQRFEEALEAQLRAAAEAADATDLAVVARGTDSLVLRGAVKAIEAKGVQFLWNDRETPLPWERIAGILFARPTPRNASCLVRLRDGDVFGGRVVAGDAETLAIESGIFSRRDFRWEHIERIDCSSDRMIFLSEMKPARYEMQPFFSKKWEYAFDRTLWGNPIRMGGREFRRGVCMHSESTLTFALEGRFQQFAAFAGVLDEVAPRGCVMMEVLGDGKPLWSAHQVRGGEPPRSLVVSVAGVRELTLRVEFDEELDVSDHACWAFARLIR